MDDLPAPTCSSRIRTPSRQQSGSQIENTRPQLASGGRARDPGWVPPQWRQKRSHSFFSYFLFRTYRESLVVREVMGIAPVLARCFDFNAGPGGKPVRVLCSFEGNWTELYLGTHRFQSDIFHVIFQPRFDLRDHTGFWIDPGDP